MSNIPDNEFDLEKLFLPAWAQQEPSSAKYAKYEGEAGPSDRRGDRRGPRPPRREGGNRREGNRRPGERRGFGRAPGEQARTDAAPGERGPRRGPPREPRRERREPPAPLPEVNVSVVPDEKVVESLTRQIKITGRAYPLFDIAQMILQKPERHAVIFSVKKNAENKPVQPLFLCALDDSLWLSEDEAVGHVLRKHFNTFYQAEKTATEPPKGKYTFVAQCGMSGVILGPPNYHDYQNQLRKLHSERFSRMPFEMYKSRVKIVRDETVVKQWVDEQSWKTEYICLNMPEPLKLPNKEAVEQHFRESHKDNIIKSVETQTLSGTAVRNLRSPELVRLSRSVWEDQRRFPLQIATVLSQQFAGHGLQFFKVNKTITHVSVARPHYLDLALTPVSEGVKRIVEYIDANPKCTRRQLLTALVPAPAPAPAPVPAVSATETAEAPVPAAPTATPVEPASETNAEQNALMGDLHWLIHQGHVIEFANGTLETAKKPLPRPPKKEPKPAEGAPEGAVATVAAEASSDAAGVETPVSDLPTEEGQAAASMPDQPAAETVAPQTSVAPSADENPASVESPEASHNGPPPVPTGKPPAEKPEDIVPSPS